MKKLLIVEDEPGYRTGADKYFSQTDVQADYAVDYGHAMELLKGDLSDESYDGTIIDCFFPASIGSSDIELGREAVKKMKASDPVESKARQIIEKFSKYADLDDELGPLVKTLAYSEAHTNHEPLKLSVLVSTKEISKTRSSADATRILKETLRIKHKGLVSECIADSMVYYSALEEGMRDEANQPLGIMVAERVEELKVHFVLATSIPHHDARIKPMHDYVHRKRWWISERSPGNKYGKTTPEFWENAWGLLKARAKLKH